jgi:hypothetical protein
MTNTDPQDHDEIPGVRWIVDYSFDPPQRQAEVNYDVNTLISLVDICDAASYHGGQHTAQNAAIFRDYALRIIRELESRSLVNHRQWQDTAHLAAAE